MKKIPIAPFWRRWFWKKPQDTIKYPKKENQWGNALYSLDTCWMLIGKNLKAGNGMEVEMQSGRLALLRITEVDTPQDPGDQHFIKTEFIRYLKREEEIKIKEGK